MDNVKQYLSILAEEYKSLRDEVKQASINMFAALRWGAAVLGVVIAAGFTQWNKQHAVVLLIFYIVIPLLSAMAMFLWLGEAARFKRVGDYICFIEQKAGMIIDVFKQQYAVKEKWLPLQKQIEENIAISHSSLDLSDPLAWEQWLKDMKGKGGTGSTEGHLAWIYKIRLAFFPLLMLFSFLTGTYYVLTHPRFVPSWLAPFGSFIPEAKTNAVILLLLSIIIIFITTLMAFVIGRRLDVKTKPIIRNQSEQKS